MTCSWTDNLGHKCSESAVVTATVSQLPYITPAAVGHLPAPVMRVGYCEVHRLARLAQLGKVRADMEVEARMLAAVDRTLDEAIKAAVDKAVLTASAPLVVALEAFRQEMGQVHQLVSGYAMGSRDNTTRILTQLTDLRLKLGRRKKRTRRRRA